MTVLGSIAGALATTLAAIIAGTIAFLSAILSKEQKTSEFRQSWIDSLRNDLADFVGETAVLVAYGIDKGQLGADLTAFLDAHYDGVCKAAAAYHRILLRLNPVEHKELLGSLRIAYLLYAGEGELTTVAVEQVLEKVVANGQVVLKTEWKRVKRGEAAYFLTKYGALLVALFALAKLVLLWSGR